MATVSFGNLVDPEQQQLERNRALAEALRQQGNSPIESQTASGGLVVPITKGQGLSKLVQMLAGKYATNKADEAEKAYGEKKRGAQSEEMQAFISALRGTPEKAGFPTGANEMGDESVMQNPVPAKAADPNAAMAMALRSQNPGLQQMGGALLANSLPKAPKMERVEIPDGQGGKRVGFVDMNSPNPYATFKEGGVDPVKGVAINGQLTNPINASPIGSAVPKQPDAPNQASDLLIPDGKGSMMPNKPLIGVKTGLAQAGRANVNNTVINAGEKEFSKETGKLDAKQLAEMRDRAVAASNSIETAKNLRGAIQRGVYSGGGANAKTAAANLINGITGVTPKNLPGSQLFNAEASKLVLDHVKTLGANPSNADREFIEKTVPAMASSPEARDAMIDFLEKKAVKTIDNYKRADTYARKNNSLSGFDLVETPKANGNSVLEQADAILNGGR